MKGFLLIVMSIFELVLGSCIFNYIKELDIKVYALISLVVVLICVYLIGSNYTINWGDDRNGRGGR